MEEARDILQDELPQSVAYQNWHGLDEGLLLSAWDNFCSIYAHHCNYSLKDRGFVCWTTQIEFQKKLMERDEVFRLGDVFELSLNLEAEDKKFLRLLLEVFHTAQERNESFPEKLNELINKTTDPENVYLDEFKNIVNLSPREQLYYAIVFWVWDQGTKMLWHFHRIRNIIPVYGNGQN